jgi:hypothetical protein
MKFETVKKVYQEVHFNLKKDGFPIPSPEANEDEDTYISKCIPEIIGEYPEEGQAYAVCKSKWDEKK